MATVDSYTIKSGKRFRVRWMANGTQQAKAGFASRREAETYGLDREADIRRGIEMPVESERSQVTVGEMVESFLSSKTDIRASTLSGYRTHAENHVLPSLGKMMITDLDHETLEDWQASLGNYSTTKQSRQVLNGALHRAIVLKHLTSNPLDTVPGPTKPESDKAFLTKDQVDRLTLAAGPDGLLIVFLAHSGVRISEAAALVASDFDLDNAQVKVWHQLEDGDRATQKTRRSKRVVPLTSKLVTRLTPVIVTLGQDEFVFTSPTGKPLNKRNFARRNFKRAVERAGLGHIEGLTPHSLRHTCASWMIAAGVPLVKVSRHLGHQSVRVTEQTYVHLLPGDAEAAEALDRFVGEAV